MDQQEQPSFQASILMLFPTNKKMAVRVVNGKSDFTTVRSSPIGFSTGYLRNISKILYDTNVKEEENKSGHALLGRILLK